MICVSRTLLVPRRPGADVIADAGAMVWAKAMGAHACLAACAYLRDDAATRLVVDPFCGHGTVLAAANALGLDAIGVDLSEKRCRAARRLVLPGA
jgi:SAM-dependent methyltransferase